MLKTSLKKHFSNIKMSVKNDSSNLFAFDESCDMAIISGTGSVAFVKNGDEYIRLGGWGNLFDEAGSAYDIGRDAVRRALFEEDNRLPTSTLSKKLYEKMGTKTAWENIKKLYAEGKPYIASLAPVVFEAYQNGDTEAARIIEKNAKALSELLCAGVRLYGAKQTAIASGGIFEHYSDILLEYMRRYTSVKLTICDLPPVYGACRKAVSLDKDINNDFYDNFKLSYGGIK
jgi:N-acetylglucosamine kinase-like BadF-type ATPase